MRKRTFMTHCTAARGFSLLELIVVVTILGILAVSLTSGYTNMQRNQRLINATDKVLSALYLARGLAISNNAVYHVRLENYKPGEQYVSVYCFPRIAVALTVHDDSSDPGIAANVTTIDDPIPSNNSHKQTVLKPNAWNPTTDINYIDQNTAWLDPTTGLATPPLTSPTYNNYLVQKVRLDPHTYLGVQSPINTSTPSSRVLFFYPDGTAEVGPSAFNVYVTDDDQLWENRASTGYTDVNNTRIKLYNEKLFPGAAPISTNPQSSAKMIKVLRGGMIKLLKAEAVQ